MAAEGVFTPEAGDVACWFAVVLRHFVLSLGGTGRGNSLLRGQLKPVAHVSWILWADAAIAGWADGWAAHGERVILVTADDARALDELGHSGGGSKIRVEADSFSFRLFFGCSTHCLARAPRR